MLDRPVSKEVLTVVPVRSPWISFAAAERGKRYLAMVSYFRLKGLGAMPKFLWNALRVGRQLSRSEGLVCCSAGARPGNLEFWSLTVWEDERGLKGFVRASPHSKIMEEMRPHVRRSEFMRWELDGAFVPPKPREAEGLLRRRLAASSGNPAAKLVF